MDQNQNLLSQYDISEDTLFSQNQMVQQARQQLSEAKSQSLEELLTIGLPTLLNQTNFGKTVLDTANKTGRSLLGLQTEADIKSSVNMDEILQKGIDTATDFINTQFEKITERASGFIDNIRNSIFQTAEEHTGLFNALQSRPNFDDDLNFNNIDNLGLDEAISQNIRQISGSIVPQIQNIQNQATEITDNITNTVSNTLSDIEESGNQIADAITTGVSEAETAVSGITEGLEAASIATTEFEPVSLAIDLGLGIYSLVNFIKESSESVPAMPEQVLGSFQAGVN